MIFLVTTGAILPFIDRIGRRTLLLSGSIICCCLHFIIAADMATLGHHVDEVNGNDSLKWEINGAPGKAMIAMSYIFVGVYGLTWAPTGWVYCSEVFPLKYRAKGVGLSAATNWIFNCKSSGGAVLTTSTNTMTVALAFFVAPAFTNIQWKTCESHLSSRPQTPY